MGIPACRRARASRPALAVRGLVLLCRTAARSLSPVAVGVGVAVSGVVLFTNASRRAKELYDSAYGYERTWNAILRLVRVDLGMKVLDKDDANGYLLFEYRSSDTQKPTTGSFELIRGAHGRTTSASWSSSPRCRTAHERVLLDHLARKMRDEYGEPAEPRTPPAAPDAGRDGNENEDNN